MAGKVLECWTCGGNHLKRDCPEPKGHNVHFLNVPETNGQTIIGDGRKAYSGATESELNNLEREVKMPQNHSVQSQGSGGRQVIYTNSRDKHKRHNKHYRGNYNNNNRSYSHYIFLSDVNATTATKALDPLEKPVLHYMSFKDLTSKKNDGRYEGVIDTGANTPAMQTKYAVNEGMSIWKLRRPIMVETAGGIITCSYATVVSVLNTFEMDNPYWMTTIFYLIDELPVEILIDRRTMRLLGLDVQKMSTEKYTHNAEFSQT